MTNKGSPPHLPCCSSTPVRWERCPLCFLPRSPTMLLLPPTTGIPCSSTPSVKTQLRCYSSIFPCYPSSHVDVTLLFKEKPARGRIQSNETRPNNQINNYNAISVSNINNTQQSESHLIQSWHKRTNLEEIYLLIVACAVRLRWPRGSPCSWLFLKILPIFFTWSANILLKKIKKSKLDCQRTYEIKRKKLRERRW